MDCLNLNSILFQLFCLLKLMVVLCDFILKCYFILKLQKHNWDSPLHPDNWKGFASSDLILKFCF